MIKRLKIVLGWILGLCLVVLVPFELLYFLIRWIINGKPLQEDPIYIKVINYFSK